MIFSLLFAFSFGAAGFIVGAMISTALKLSSESWLSAMIMFVCCAFFEIIGIYFRLLLCLCCGV